MNRKESFGKGVKLHRAALITVIPAFLLFVSQTPTFVIISTAYAIVATTLLLIGSYHILRGIFYEAR